MNSLVTPVTATEFRTSLLHGRTVAEPSPCTSAQASLLSQPLLGDLVKHGPAHGVPRLENQRPWLPVRGTGQSRLGIVSEGKD